MIPAELPPGLAKDFPVGSRCRYCGSTLNVESRCNRCAPLLAEIRSLDDYRRFVADALRSSDA